MNYDKDPFYKTLKIWCYWWSILMMSLSCLQIQIWTPNCIIFHMQQKINNQMVMLQYCTELHFKICTLLKSQKNNCVRFAADLMEFQSVLCFHDDSGLSDLSLFASLYRICLTCTKQMCSAIKKTGYLLEQTINPLTPEACVNTQFLIASRLLR